jgi:hypothetical protein
MGEAELVLVRVDRGHGDFDTTTRTRAPIFNSLSRIVPQVAAANWVWPSAIRRKAHSST